MNRPTSPLSLQRGQHPAGQGLPSVPGGEQTPLPQDGNDHRQARHAAPSTLTNTCLTKRAAASRERERTSAARPDSREWLGPPPGGSALARCGQSASPATAYWSTLHGRPRAPPRTGYPVARAGGCAALFARCDCGHRAWGAARAGCATRAFLPRIASRGYYRVALGRSSETGSQSHLPAALGTERGACRRGWRLYRHR